jgi:aldehyde:ferredoxin oxidoreductase
MRPKGGYHKRILEVDLSSSKAVSRPVSDDYAMKYIGGRGYGARMTWDALRQGFDPRSPENVVSIAPGPLNGLLLPSAGKTSFSCISPATGIYADSNMGGSFGAELRLAGYDGLSIRGRADELSYLWIDDLQTEIRKAPDLKGRGATETERILKDEIGDEQIRVATIGPAGENGVVFATVNSDWGRNAGRTGMGAVLGSKNLKAVAIRGTQDLPVSDMEALMDVSRRAFDYLRKHTSLDIWQRQGLMTVIDYANTVGFLPTRNFSDAYFEKAESINGDVMESNYKIGDSACFCCPMCCGNICLVRKGKWAGAVCEGPEYETAAMFGSNLGMDDFSFILKANELADELGMDTISAGNLIGAVMEGVERGLLSSEDAGGDVRWGEGEGAIRLMEMIARREGIGEVLSRGSKGLISRWPQLERILVQVKGLEQSAYDSRVSLCMALAYGTCDIGAHHTRAWPIAKELEMGQEWGLKEKVDLVMYHQALRPVFDMLGVCRLPWIELSIDENLYAEMYSAVVGIPFTLQDLFERSKAIYDLTRAISVRLGVRRKDDYPSPRTFEDPVISGPFAGKTADRKEYEDILNMYYGRRGWDARTGVPLGKTLIEDGLEDVAAVLERELGEEFV